MVRIIKGLLFLSLLGPLTTMASTPDPCSNPSTNWIKVLIAQDTLASNPQQPNDYSTTVAKMYQLAPAAEQIHLRVLPQDPNASGAQSNADQVAQMIVAVRQQFPNVALGYHPDNYDDQDTYTAWGCTFGNWQCMFTNSIKYMNMINNSQVLTTAHVTGFSIFSIEQSYPEVTAGISELSLQKQCLQGSTNSICSTAASPAVTYGYVGPSYGSISNYGTNGFDYGYPQYYNIEVKFPYNGQLLPFPTDTLPPAGLVLGTNYVVIDADQPCSYANQNPLPYQFAACNPTSPSRYSIYSTADPDLAASYLGWIIVNKGLATAAHPNNDQTITIYITLSGEGDGYYNFLGSPGWTMANLNRFHCLLTNYLQAQGVAVDDNSLKFGIWQFQPMLANISSTSGQ